MLSKEMESALNEQVNAEFYSAYLYLSMGTYFEAQNLSGFAGWMRVQFQEEQFHALKLMDYISSRGGRVWLKAIAGPDSEWKGAQAVFATTLEHERHVSALIHKLVKQALAESDHATHGFLQWYVNEQVEEEATAERILHQIKMVGESGQALFLMDRELGKRGAVGGQQV